MGHLPKTLQGVQLNGAAVWGMAAMYVGYWFHYWGGPLSLRFVSMELAGLRWISHLVFCALTAACVLAVAWRRPTERVEETLVSAMQTGALICGLVGTVLSLSLVMGPSTTAALHSTAVAFVAGALTGVTMGSLLCAWCVLTARLGVRSTLACNICATALGGSGLYGLRGRPADDRLRRERPVPPRQLSLYGQISQSTTHTPGFPAGMPGYRLVWPRPV